MRARLLVRGFAAVCFLSCVAHATPEEDQAEQAEQVALDGDFAAKKYPAALAKLNKAIARCTKKKCAPAVLARLHRDAGVVSIAGLGDKKNGLFSFKQAVEADKGVTLEARFATPEVRAQFEKAGGSPVALIEHEPPSKQKLGVRIPVYVQLPDSLGAEAFEASWRRSDEPSWHSEKLESMQGGWGASLPCDAVTEPGTVEYFVRASSGGKEIARAGSEAEPFKVEVTKDFSGEPETLPGKEAPPACAVKAAAPAVPSEASGAGKKIWLRLGLHQDFSFIGGKNVCSPATVDSGEFYCFHPSDNTQYIGTPQQGQFNSIASGAVPATARVLAGGDYVIDDHLSVGASIGFAFAGGAPRPVGGSRFFALHLEGRGAFWFVGAPFNPDGFALNGFFVAGAAEVDAKKRVPVVEDLTVVPPANEPAQQELDAWNRLGRGFAGVGAGAYYGFGNFGLLLELRGLYMFPGSGVVISPGLYGAMGF